MKRKILNVFKEFELVELLDDNASCYDDLDEDVLEKIEMLISEGFNKKQIKYIVDHNCIHIDDFDIVLEGISPDMSCDEIVTTINFELDL